MNAKTCLGLCVAVFASASSVYASGTFVGLNDIGTNHVTAATAETGLVSVGPGGMLYKTGTGTWTVPLGAFGSWNVQDVVLMNGGLTVDMDDAEPVEAECPTDVIGAKALFWFDASTYATHPERFETRTVGDKTFMDKMYDVRETDTANRTHPVAVAEHLFRYVKPGFDDGNQSNCATSNNAEKILSPEIVTFDGKPAFYFGGVGSGRRMGIWRKDKTGTVDTRDVVHVFMVQYVKDGSGPAFSPSFRSVGCWEGTAARSLNAAMLHTDEGIYVLGHRMYVNGVKKDGLVDTPTVGLSVFDCELTSTLGIVKHLFLNDSCGDGAGCKIAPDDDGSRATVVQRGGGDYVYEMLCFTNRLTTIERQRTIEYLTRKWMPAVPGGLRVHTAAGTTVRLTGDGSVTNVLARNAQTTLEKTGAGTLVFAKDVDDVSVQYGATTLADGQQALLERPAPVAIAAGKGISAVDDDLGAVLTQSSLPADKADRFVKSGKASILVREVPSDIKRIDVNKGKIVFHPRNLGSEETFVGETGDRVFVPVPNASFEERADGDAGKWGKVITGDYCGWTLTADSGKNSFVYDIDSWGLFDAGKDGATRSLWGLLARPHHGSSALVILRNTGIRTKESLAFKAGRYEMEYWSCTRGSSIGGLMSVSLIDPETGTETTVMREFERYNNTVGFGLNRFRFTVPTDGPRYLCFRMADGLNTDRITVLDDISLWRIANDRVDATEWAIPGGDFNQVTTDTGNCATTTAFSVQYIWHPDWTLVQPEGVAPDAKGTNLGVGIGDEFMNSLSTPTVFYNDSRYPYRSPQLTFLLDGASASLVFTPPAGTWYLKADLAENGAWPDCKVKAEVTPEGGSPIVLGNMRPACKSFKTMRFTDSAFTADGKTSYTLKLSYTTKSAASGNTKVAIYVDDLMLTKAKADTTALNCLKTWREDFTGWSGVKSEDGGQAGLVNFPNNPSHGKDPIMGTTGVYVRYGGSYVTTYDFLKPGTYRLSYYQNRMLTSSAVSPLKVWIAQGGVTNLLGVEKCGTGYQRESSCVFRIPEGDSYSYTLGFTSMGLKGTNDEDGYSYFDAVLDNISLSTAADGELLDTDDMFSPDLRIDVAKNAMIDLNFHGTNRISKLRFDGKPVHGVVTSKTHPEYVAGPGALLIEPVGSLIIFR